MSDNSFRPVVAREGNDPAGLDRQFSRPRGGIKNRGAVTRRHNEVS